MKFLQQNEEIKEKYINDEIKKSFSLKEYIILLFMGIISTIICTYYNMNTGIQSDIASYAMWGHDISTGNLLLSGWIMPTNSFYVLSLISGLIGNIIGFNSTLSFLVGALVYTFAILSTCFIILKLNKNRSSAWLMIIIIYIIAVIPHNELFGGAHIDIVSFILISFYLIYTSEEKYNNRYFWRLGIAYILLSLGGFSDNLVLYYGIAPIFVTFALKFIFENKGKRKKQRFFCIINIVLSIISASVAILLPKIIKKMGGFELAGYGKPEFASLQDITKRIIGIFQNILSQFGANFFNSRVSEVDRIVLFCNLFIFIILILVLILHYSNTSNINTFTVLSVFSIVFCMLMLIFANYESINSLYTLYTTRLMWVQFFLILILFGSIDVREYIEKIHINKCIQFVIIFGVVAFSFFSRLDHISFNEKSENTFDKICEVLQENNLQNGFGSYWYSHAVTVTSSGKNVIYPISGEKPQRFRWISKKVPDDIYANFVILKDNDTEFRITEQSLINSVGSLPVRTIHVDNVSIYIWDNNIAPYFANLLDNSDVIINGASMLANPNATIVESSMILNQGGIIYGPYTPVKQGSYQVIFYGTNLDLGISDVYSYSLKINEDTTKLNYKIVKQTSTEIVIDFTLNKDIADLEIRLFNITSDKIITVDKVEIKR